MPLSLIIITISYIITIHKEPPRFKHLKIFGTLRLTIKQFNVSLLQLVLLATCVLKIKGIPRIFACKVYKMSWLLEKPFCSTVSFLFFLTAPCNPIENIIFMQTCMQPLPGRSL